MIMHEMMVMISCEFFLIPFKIWDVTNAEARRVSVHLRAAQNHVNSIADNF
jgi:hypothetical protein